MAACPALLPGLPTSSSPPCKAGVILRAGSFPPRSRALPDPVVLGASEPQGAETVTSSSLPCPHCWAEYLAHRRSQ